MRIHQHPLLLWGWRYTVCAVLLMVAVRWGGFLAGPSAVLVPYALAYAIPAIIVLLAWRNEDAASSALIWYWRLSLAGAVVLLLLAVLRHANR